MNKKAADTKEATVQPEGEAGPEEPAREIWEAQPLSLRNTARLIRLLAGQLIQKIIFDAPKLQGASDSAILVAVLEVLDEQSLTELFSIAVDQPPKAIKENYDAAKAMGAMVDFLRISNFGSLWGEARRLGGAGQARKKRKGKGKGRRSASKK